MGGGTLSIGLTLAAAVVVAAGVGALVGRIADEIAAAAAVVAGLVLVGVAWLPRTVPKAEPPVVVTAAPIVLSGDRQRTEIGPSVPAGPLPPLPGREAARISIEATEAEPNDTLPSANHGDLGISIDGTLQPGDRDWFAIDVPTSAHATIVANVVTENASVTMTLFDEAGQAVGIARTIDEVRVRSAALERNLVGPRYYVLLMPASDVPARYQLTVAARRG